MKNSVSISPSPPHLGYDLVVTVAFLPLLLHMLPDSVYTYRGTEQV